MSNLTKTLCLTALLLVFLLFM